MGSEKVHQTPESRRDFYVMIGIAVVAAVLGVVLGLAIDWFPIAASREADRIDTLWDVLIIASVPIFVLVQAVVLYCVYKFRMKPGEEDKDGPPIHGNTRIEIIWTALPALLLLGLCAYAYVVLVDVEEEAAAAQEMNVRVVGEQFTWTFHYPGQDGKEVASNQLYLPVNRRVQFNVQAKDVIHDFWVPAFRMKIDAVPGITTDYRVTPTRQGRYPVVCAELCGLGHAAMRQTAHVVPQAEFERWLEEKRNPPAPGGDESAPAEATAEAGKALFVDAGCNACHTLADAGSQSDTGPVLDETLPGQSVEEIVQDIADPNAEIVEGFGDGIMPPNYEETLGEQGVESLALYLSEVTK